MERSIIAGVFKPEQHKYEIDYILEEVKLLTESAGSEVYDLFYQKRKSCDKKYLIGKGKVSEIKKLINLKNIDLIVFYNYLNNTQQRNLENYFKIKVIDRTRLILDIFATRAKSIEGKLQVELAQLLYLLPRLTGKGVELSRLGGGIGTRGPGETKLEVDRRRIKKRISVLKKRLVKVKKNRDVQRKGRKSYPVPVVSLVGYTSAGKSTLFKQLTSEDVRISEKLFSTLDPLLRRVSLGEIKTGYYFLLSDTVGFIRDMPRELLQSFKATFEDMIQSDIILHIVDVSNSEHLDQKREVEKILEQINISNTKVVTVYNKIDLLEGYSNFLNQSDKNEVFISAKENIGILKLKKFIFNKYFKDYERYMIVIPENVFNINSIRNWSIIINQSKKDGLIYIDVLSSKKKMIKFRQRYGGYVK